jgi:hypothetical protein
LNEQPKLSEIAKFGCAGNQKILKSNMAAKFITNGDEFDQFCHNNEFKKYSMAKRAYGIYLKTVLRNDLGGMQQNVTM